MVYDIIVVMIMNCDNYFRHLSVSQIMLLDCFHFETFSDSNFRGNKFHSNIVMIVFTLFIRNNLPPPGRWAYYIFRSCFFLCLSVPRIN